MNYFAKLLNNISTEVVCLSETIENGAEWCAEQYGGQWVQTYDNNPNKTYGNIGYQYDESTQNFIEPPVEEIDEP